MKRECWHGHSWMGVERKTREKKERMNGVSVMVSGRRKKVMMDE